MIKHFINVMCVPQIMFTLILAVFFFIFPPTERLYKLNHKLGLNRIWTNTGGIIMFLVLIAFFLFGITDANFRLIVTKPDNVPIVGLLFLVVFFLWVSLKQAFANDRRILKGEGPSEEKDAKENILVWPDLVYIEMIAMVVVAAFLIVWAIALKAPLEGPANPSVSPNPSKAPWYFLGLQEMLVYFDPWIAGVLFPTIMIVGLMCIPFVDNNPKGCGYYTFKDRKMAVSIFLFFWLVLWIFLITTGTFLRGPNWSFFGPFEYWDPHKFEAITNINLSQWVYGVCLNRPLPENIFLREIWGFLVLGCYFGVLPIVLTMTVCRKMFQSLGLLRYSIFVGLMLCVMSLPIKMYLRWIFNLKYIVAIPEIFLNI